jgi:signal transduction histidine kinase
MDRSAILRRPLTRLVVPEDQDTLYLARRRLFETGQHQSFEARLRRQKGDPLWVSFEMVPSRNGGGGDGQARFLAAVSDISQRKAAEEELRRQNDELSRFATTVSHDLRSPLVTVKTFLGYLDQNLADGEVAAVTEDMGFIHTAVDRMERLMEELLQLSRAGRTVVKALRVPLQAVVDEALALVAGQVSARGVNVTVTDAPVVLVGDRERLVGVFQNLLDNAVKFLGDQPSPRIEVGAETTGDEVVIFVRDNGIGIEPLATLRIFGVFEQLDPGSGGTGLGLALVKRTIEGHGGRIWVESAGPGQGSTFRFTLSGTRMGPA